MPTTGDRSMMLSQSYTRNPVTSEPDIFANRSVHSSSDATAVASIAIKASSKRSPTSSSNQLLAYQANKQSLPLTDSDERLSNTGAPQTESRSAGSLQLDPQSRRDDDGQTGRGIHHGVTASRDAPLRASKEGRPTSRPGAPSAQSPYLQPPGGRSSQGGSHRPNSRPQSQGSPQPQHSSPQHPSPQHAAPPGATGALARSSAGSSSSSSMTPSFINGARIIQTYCAPVGKPTGAHSKQGGHILPGGAHPRPAADPQQSQTHLQQQQQQQLAHAAIAAVAATQQQQQQQASQVQGPRPTLAQQQQQQAGPRATTALSGARSMQRARQDSGTGGPAEPGQGGPRLGAAAAPGGGHTHHPGQYGAVPGHVPIGTVARDSEGNSASFGYDDIPEEEMDETCSPLHNAYSGLTLDQYMQRMVTTPASAAATSGLGVSADSGEESAPCSPGNASTRTEEDDAPYPCPSPSRGPGPSGLGAGFIAGPGGGRTSDAGERHGQLRPTGRGLAGGGTPAALAPGMPVRLGCSAGRVGSRFPGDVGVGGPGSGTGAGLARPAGSLSGGVRASGTNTATYGSGRVPGSAGMTDGFLGGGGGGVDVSSLMLDGDSSDDEQHNPSALINSPRTARHLSSRASAMAFSNSLDLRPATAAVVSSPSMTRGDPAASRGMAMSLGADSGNHHAIIKQVDLGGLSASLFTPNNPNAGRESSSPAAPAATSLASAAAAAADILGPSNPSSPEMASVATARGDRRAAAAGAAGSGAVPPAVAILQANLSAGGGGTGGAAGTPKSLASPKTPVAGIPPPWGVSAREGAFGGGPAGDGAAAAGSLQALAARPLSSRGRPGAAAAGGSGAGGGSTGVGPESPSGSPSAAAAGVSAAAGSGGAGRPGSGMKWAKPQQSQKPPDGGPVDLPPEARQLAAEAQSMARPPTRQVQSARPPGARGEVELDPSVWQANIAMQLQRPPSRQKPPPEALHLWTPEQQMSMLAAGSLGRNGGRPLGGRPQSAAPTTYRGTRPTSGPSVKAHGPVGDDLAGAVARPPSRQKPPPLSTLLEHDDFPPPPPAGSRRPRPGADQLNVVLSGPSSSDEDDDDEDDLH